MKKSTKIILIIVGILIVCLITFEGFLLVKNKQDSDKKISELQNEVTNLKDGNYIENSNNVLENTTNEKKYKYQVLSIFRYDNTPSLATLKPAIIHTIPAINSSVFFFTQNLVFIGTLLLILFQIFFCIIADFIKHIYTHMLFFFC